MLQYAGHVYWIQLLAVALFRIVAQIFVWSRFASFASNFIFGCGSFVVRRRCACDAMRLAAVDGVMADITPVHGLTTLRAGRSVNIIGIR